MKKRHSRGMKRMSREGVEEKTLQIKIYVYTWKRMDWNMEKIKKLKFIR